MIYIEADSKYAVFSEALLRDRFEQTVRGYEKRYAFSMAGARYTAASALLLIHITNIPTSKIMQSVLTSFSKYLGGYYSSRGKKFRDRYKSFLIRDEYISEVMEADISELVDKEKNKKYLRKKGRIIDAGSEKKRAAVIEAGFGKVLEDSGIEPGSREAGHALAVMLRRHTLLTNRQISQRLGLSESAVSKILYREARPEKEESLIELCESRIKKNTDR